MKKLFFVLLFFLSDLMSYAESLSGQLSNGVTYSLDVNTGKLYFEGYGAVKGYSDAKLAPWYEWKEFIEDVVFAEGITSIGSHTFQEYHMKTISIPNTVTYIGEFAFSGCNTLSSVVIPKSVRTIDHFAFSSLRNGLRSLTLPSTVHGGINADMLPAFSHTSVDSLLITCESQDDFISYLSRDDIGTVFPGGKRKISINDVVQTSIIIPEGVEKIGSCAFENCKDLDKIVIPNSVTNIGSYAFSACSTSTPILIPNTIASIADGMFFGYEHNSITIPSSVVSIGKNAFAYSHLTSISIPGSVTTIGESAFANSADLESIHISKSVLIISSLAFSYCSGLKSIVVEEGNPRYDSRENCNCLINTKNNEVIIGCSNSTIPFSVEKIAGSSFRRCTDLLSITIPNSVTSIGNDAFYGCSSLSSITIPNSVTDIGSSAFQDCSNLTSVTIGTSVKEIEMFTFRGCSNLKDIIIPANVDKIGQFTFEGCEKLISVTNLSEIPQKIDNTQFSVYGDLHVKKGCKEAYLASEYWSMFNIIEDAEELTDIETLSGIDNNVPIYNLRGQQLNSLQKGFNIMNGRKVYVK